MSGISIELYFDPMNGPLANRTGESNFTACQNSIGEHSFEGVPASLYNLTKSVPDPFMNVNFNLNSPRQFPANF